MNDLVLTGILVVFALCALGMVVNNGAARLQTGAPSRLQAVCMGGMGACLIAVGATVAEIMPGIWQLFFAGMGAFFILTAVLSFVRASRRA